MWSPTSPEQHTVAVALSGGSVVERFGLRTFGVEPASARLTVNGRVVKLTGWSHHTQWPGQGAERTFATASPTDAQMDEVRRQPRVPLHLPHRESFSHLLPPSHTVSQDIALLLAGGANYVRGAHYPQVRNRPQPR